MWLAKMTEYVRSEQEKPYVYKCRKWQKHGPEKNYLRNEK